MVVNKRTKSLSHGRPPRAQVQERMSSQQSRTIIRTHHRLQKEHAAAIRKGDVETAERVSESIEKNGGLKVYQAASKQGQSKDRGGDSSRVLVEWLQQAKLLGPKASHSEEGSGGHVAPYRLLEVGALSTTNEISQYPQTIHVTRIDLNSQGPGIQKQDFMERPLPTTSADQFDIVSLSLVLNYVPDPVGRGEMLKRIAQFLRKLEAPHSGTKPVLPALFFVLPLPCVENSRYLDEELLLRIMTNLGFDLTNNKATAKLCYYLFTSTGEGNGAKTGKKSVRHGSGMNNFCIVVE
ncbi:putative methyltransferase-domain-containing protein [Massariosphaeria phaeospora]|uniref:25S rRNA adenine-N(1) methyltransferase n=1 Tax=Massariosphaeria phaeospora TaxID=100035 RepID=A0A7C8IAE6_9PLEO|nr:putative methyltransferase-domain-containing protein [Massariosphaeria phaeospora]